MSTMHLSYSYSYIHPHEIGKLGEISDWLETDILKDDLESCGSARGTVVKKCVFIKRGWPQLLTHGHVSGSPTGEKQATSWRLLF